MTNTIDGVRFFRKNNCGICYIKNLSDDLKQLIRCNLTTICHGSHISDYSDEPLFSYEATLESFLERYDKKTPKTKKGMIGEFLSHILITTLFAEFDIASAFFNLEEKSIKKGFDLLLYNSLENSVWITEVKSGNKHKNKSHDQTNSILLNTAKSDLKVRLNEQEKMYWYNAVNSVRASLHDEKDYKKALIKILVQEGNATTQNKANSGDNCVFLVSNLFGPLSNPISPKTVDNFLKTTEKEKLFEKTVVFSIQKATYSKIVNFLKSEVIT